MKTLSFTVSIPTDNGFIGRRCPLHGCRKYFKVRQNSIKGQTHCAYCGARSNSDAFTTDNQEKHMREQAEELAFEHASRLLDKEFGKIAKSFKGGSFVNMKFTPAKYRAKKVFPRYRENKVDSELKCPTCSLSFQVYGIFGYCPGCSAENMMVYDANITIIRKELKQSEYSDRALRHAYADIVSAFEQFCSRNAPVSIADTNFQDLFETRRAFKKAFDIDLLKNLEQSRLLALRRVFQKRHVFTHNQGIVNEKYVKKFRKMLLCLAKRLHCQSLNLRTP